MDILSEEERIMQKYLDDMLNAGAMKLYDANFKDLLIFGEAEITIEGLLSKYGDLLTAEEMNKIKSLINKDLDNIIEINRGSSPD